MQFFTTPISVRATALATLVILGACSKKSDDATPTPAATTYATTWTADGKNYTATTSNGAVNNNILIIGATQAVSSNESYQVTLSVPAATGTYTLGSANASTATLGYATTVAGTSTGYIAASSIGSGTVVVTTLSSTEIIGTFTFTGMATTVAGTMKAVTNGKFAIKR